LARPRAAEALREFLEAVSKTKTFRKITAKGLLLFCCEEGSSGYQG